MANAFNTGSTLSLPNGTNKTSTSISTNMIILVNNTPVGAIKSLSINENRKISKIPEVGTDGFIDSTPSASTEISGSCQRTRYDRLRITEAFSRGFIHAHAQVYPFDIVILDRQKRDEGSQISTVIKNVWITSLEYTLSADDWVIVDNMQWTAETIFSVLNGGSSPISGGHPAAVGGELGILHMGGGPNGLTPNMVAEQLADTNAGGRRGSMDASGLIDLGSNGELLF